MKSFLIFATLLFAFAVSVNAKPHHPLPPHVQAATDVCLKKLDLTEEQIHRHKESEEENKDHGCFKACIDKELGIMDEDGNFDKAEAIKNFPPFVPQENRTRIVDACFEQKGADDCETAALYHSCVKKMLPRPPKNPELQKIHDSCKEKLGLTDEEIKSMKDSKEENKKDCFLACLIQGTGITMESGALNAAAFVEKSPPFVPKEDAQKIADECAKEEAADECETAYLLHKCFKKNKVHLHDFFGPPPPPPHEE